jgi:hypothetical protein
VRAPKSFNVEECSTRRLRGCDCAEVAGLYKDAGCCYVPRALQSAGSTRKSHLTGICTNSARSDIRSVTKWMTSAPLHASVAQGAEIQTAASAARHAAAGSERRPAGPDLGPELDAALHRIRAAWDELG